MTSDCQIEYCNHPNGPCIGACLQKIEQWREEARKPSAVTAGIPGFEPTPHTVQVASALDTQVGGDHYKKLKIQPMQYSMANKLDACQHTAIKYITRFRDKGGVADLEKAKHVIDMLIEFERGA